MSILFSALLAAATFTLPPPQEPIPLGAGMVISRSVVIKPGEYRLASDADDGSRGVIVISGDNITVDFNGAELIGTPEETPPDRRRGTAIQITGGRNITVKNVRVRGYKIALIARDAPGIRVLDSDFSYNWKQRLKSTLEREDISDWMSYHRNEKDEWLRFGAGIYLRGCDGFEVSNVTIEGGQNGLMLTECNKGTVWNNTFSFLSSIGLGMYLSSDNTVMHNRIDWCVRGYSHGVYNRGQDSAGILVYEQSSRNTFAYNSVTHGGDGFFLWAGQTTMDTGKGGCNDNLLYGNDFSHAPTNGIEATFSRNAFVNNLVLECWHGVWGGYSFESRILGNTFGLNAQAIAIEHGQENTIVDNVFHRDNEGIVLWQNETQDPEWGYPKQGDTRSRDYRVEGNLFSNITLRALHIRATRDVLLKGNMFVRNARVFSIEPDAVGVTLEGNALFGPREELPGAPSVVVRAPLNWRTEHPDAGPPLPPTMQPSGQVLGSSGDDYPERFVTDWTPWPRRAADAKRGKIESFAPAPLRGGRDPFLKKGQLRGRRYILVDEWGPYDFKSPILWPRGDAPARAVEPASGRMKRFEILGPQGAWRVVRLRGVEWVSAQSGAVPGLLDVRLPEGRVTDMEIELEYVGEAVVSPFGVRYARGKPYAFGYSRFFAPIDWEVRWFRWDESTDPRTREEAFRELIRGEPIKRERTERLDYAWFRAIGKDLPADRFATVAEGTFEVAPGEYVLSVTTDDGARVWVDGKLVIGDAWKYQESTTYTAALKLGGRHRIRIEHFDVEGYATIWVDLQPKRNQPRRHGDASWRLCGRDAPGLGAVSQLTALARKLDYAAEGGRR